MDGFSLKHFALYKVTGIHGIVLMTGCLSSRLSRTALVVWLSVALAGIQKTKVTDDGAFFLGGPSLWIHWK
ncbi:MAG: hypothetical protein AB7O96_05510 [Pseudobdellovibrionaceae bacterium]